MSAHLQLVPDVTPAQAAASSALPSTPGLDVADVLRLLGRLGQRTREEARPAAPRPLHVVR